MKQETRDRDQEERRITGHLGRIHRPVLEDYDPGEARRLQATTASSSSEVGLQPLVLRVSLKKAVPLERVYFTFHAVFRVERDKMDPS